MWLSRKQILQRALDFSHSPLTLKDWSPAQARPVCRLPASETMQVDASLRSVKKNLFLTQRKGAFLSQSDRDPTPEPQPPRRWPLPVTIFQIRTSRDKGREQVLLPSPLVSQFLRPLPLPPFAKPSLGLILGQAE